MSRTTTCEKCGSWIKRIYHKRRGMVGCLWTNVDRMAEVGVSQVCLGGWFWDWAERLTFPQFIEELGSTWKRRFWRISRLSTRDCSAKGVENKLGYWRGMRTWVDSSVEDITVIEFRRYSVEGSLQRKMVTDGPRGCWITGIMYISKVLRCPRAIGIPERAKSDVVLVNAGPEQSKIS